MRTCVIIVILATGAALSFGDFLWTEDFTPNGYLTNSAEWAPYTGAGAGIGSPTNFGGMAWLGQGQEDDAAAQVFTAQAGDVFAGMDIRINLSASAPAYTFGFFTSTYILRDKWGFDGETGNKFTVNGYGYTGDTIHVTSAPLDENTTYRLVIYFDGTDDHRFWINPDGTDFDSPEGQFTEAISAPDGFFLRQGDAWSNGNADWGMGNLIVATTFSESIDAIPEPSSALLFGFALACLYAVRRRQCLREK